MTAKRIATSLAVACIAFAVGLLSNRVSFNRQQPTVVVTNAAEAHCAFPNDLPQIRNVNYCDLMADAEHYDGWLVRFDAVMLARSGYEPIWDYVSLADPRCERELIVHEQFHLTSRTCPAVMDQLDSLLMRQDPTFPRKNAIVRVVGVFNSPKETGDHHWESERFTIVAVERAASIDEDK
jgi:hypothetical protein